MIAEITTGWNSSKTIDWHHWGNSHAVDFRMQQQNYCHVFIKEKKILKYNNSRLLILPQKPTFFTVTVS